MIGDSFKVVERDAVLVGVPLIPIDVTPRLEAAEARMAEITLRLAELEPTLDGALVWLKEIDARLDAIEAQL